jgi:hypothetical protein
MRAWQGLRLLLLPVLLLLLLPVLLLLMAESSPGCG